MGRPERKRGPEQTLRPRAAILVDANQTREQTAMAKVYYPKLRSADYNTLRGVENSVGQRIEL
jgi:hypothetical protein